MTSKFNIYNPQSKLKTFQLWIERHKLYSSSFLDSLHCLSLSVNMNTGDFYDLDHSFPHQEDHGDPFSSSVFEDCNLDGLLPPNEMLMDAAASITTAASTRFASASASASGPGGSGTPATPNSPATSSSNDVAADYGKEGKDCGDGSDQSKKACKTTKKGGKRQRQERFAFATKSDVDHLEDGYRWRKYGQKAVKNSSFPRSYYRCTTPKCPVKKRVERSYQDPSTVITTYEGKHTHASPINLRSAGKSDLFFTSPEPASTTTTTTTRFPQDRQFLMHRNFNPMVIRRNVDAKNSSSTFDLLFGNNSSASPSPSPMHHLHDQQHQFPPNHGLLQDVVPSFFWNNQQP